MKKLGKKVVSTLETVEAYAYCPCYCSSCGCGFVGGATSREFSSERSSNYSRTI